ncbi:MAG: hypothetical protein ACRC4K_14620 [Plesiomonas shigelloides]
MNKRFAKNVMFDLFFVWPLIALSVFWHGKVQEVAENAISFLGICMMIFSVIVVLAGEELTKKVAKDKGFTPRTEIHKGYQYLSCLVEVCIIASMGWYWVAAGFLSWAIFSSGAAGKAEEYHLKLSDHS